MDPTVYQPGYSGIGATELATFLKVNFTTEEQEEADILIAQVESEFASMCRRQFLYQTSGYSPIPVEYTEKLDAGKNVYFTKAFPVATIESVKIRGVEQDLTEDEDYFIYPTYIEFNTAPSAENYRRALEITYTISKFWTDDVPLIIKKLAGKLWNATEAAGVSVRERSFTSIRETFDNEAFEKEVMRTVNRYKVVLV
jgi:hypothetical protein